MAIVRPAVATGDGVSLGVSLVLLEIPDNDWIRQAISTALYLLTQEENWQEDGSNTPDVSSRVFSLILQTVDFDYEPPPVTLVGGIALWLLSSTPAGWLRLNGAAVSRTTYADLFAIYGTTFGAGDGSTTFNLPDMRDKSPYGVGSLIAVVGQSTGTVNETLTTSQIPAHNHGVTDPGHVHGINTQTGGAAGANNVIVAAVANVNTTPTVKNSNSNTTGITTQNNGGGNPHNNVHPVIGVHYIVFAGA